MSIIEIEKEIAELKGKIEKEKGKVYKEANFSVEFAHKHADAYHYGAKLNVTELNYRRRDKRIRSLKEEISILEGRLKAEKEKAREEEEEAERIRSEEKEKEYVASLSPEDLELYKTNPFQLFFRDII